MIGHVPRLEARAALLSVAVGVALLAVKFAAYFLTGSAAIFSDALESIVNVLASFFAVYSLFLAHEPPDKNHPYGHGKVEFMSAGFEGGMIVLAALVIAYKAITAFIAGQEVQSAAAGLGLMAAAMVANGGLGFYLVRLGKQRHSLTLEADGHHLLADAVTSIAVIIALAIVHLTRFKYADPIAALAVAAYITWMGVSLLRRSASGLMDTEDTADAKLLSELLTSHIGPHAREPRICSFHKLRHRHTGRYHWVDFHIVVPASWNIARGHDVASAIEHEIELALGEGDATAHVEPCTDTPCTHCAEEARRP